LNDYDNTRKITNQFLPFEIQGSKADLSTMVEMMIMLASMGFMITDLKPRVIMPGITGLRYMDAIFEICMSKNIPEMKKRFPYLEKGELRAETYQIMMEYKNKAYFAGLSSMKHFMPVIWSICEPSKSLEENLKLIPKDAPKWMFSVLCGIDLGKTPVSSEDAVDFASETLDSMYRERERQLTLGLEQKDEELKKTIKALQYSKNQIEKLTRNMIIMKTQLEECAKDMKKENEKNQTQSTLTKSIREESFSLPPELPPRESIVIPTAPPPPNQLKTSKKVIKSLDENIESSSRVNKELSLFEDSIRSSPSPMDIKTSAEIGGRQALLEQIRRGTNLKKANSNEKNLASSTFQTSQQDVKNILQKAMDLRRDAISRNNLSESLASSWDDNFTSSKFENNHKPVLGHHETKWYEKLLDTM